MKLKVLFLALPFMAIATLFTFCTKENDTAVAQENTKPSNEEVIDRRPPNCLSIVITTDQTASICGTSNGNAGPCNTCGGAPYVGLANFDATNPHLFGSSMTNGTGSITNTSKAASTISVLINGITVQQVQVPGFGCVDFVSDGTNCTFVIL